MSGRYKVRNDDFVVEEIAAYELVGEGTHTHLWIEKTGRSTLAAIEDLARAVGADKRSFGYAGMKDTHAVARQWVSVEHVDPERFAGMELDGVRVLDIARHTNKLKTGHLAGNRFSILLRGVPADEVESLRRNLVWCGQTGVPNYFGEQRFGKRGGNLDQGLQILTDAKPRRASYGYAPRILKLLLSAVQSEVFNRVLVGRIGDFDRMWDGDLAWVYANGASFPVQDLEAEQPRCADFEISPTGPLPGPRMLRAKGQAGELEDRAMSELGVTCDSFGFLKSHPGGRRPLRLRVLEHGLDATPDGPRLRFRLDPGAYATSVLRQVLESPPWFV